MGEVYELCQDGKSLAWRPMKSLPSWTQDRLPDRKEEVEPSDRNASYNRFASLEYRQLLQGTEVVMQVSGDAADIWERPPAI